MRKQMSIGREKAIKAAESSWWEGKTPREIAETQLATTELCMNFGDFQEAVEKTLDRPVWTHEFGLNVDGLWAELFGDRPTPTREDILRSLFGENR